MPDSEKVQEIFEELEFRRLKEQFLKLFSGEETARLHRLAVPKPPRPRRRPAGAGQFSLFGGEEHESIEDFSGRKTIKDVPHVYQSVAIGHGHEILSSEFDEAALRMF